MKKITLLMLPLFVVLSLGYVVQSTKSSSVTLKKIQFKGYITEVVSPTSFLVDDYRIKVDDTKSIDLENIENKSIKFDPAEQIKVGTFIKLKGTYEPETLEVNVSEIKIDMKQFQRLAQTVVLDTKPTSITKSSNGSWSGFIIADARNIVISTSTKISFKLNKSEEKEAKEEAKSEPDQEKEEADSQKDEKKKIDGSDNEQKDDKKGTDESDDDSNSKKPDEGFRSETDIDELLANSRPLQSLADVGPGVYMTYRGKEDNSGSVQADQIVFVKNERTKAEQKMWKSLRLKEKDAKKINSFGELKVGKEKYKVIPEKDVQEYVAALGESLIPDYQKQLADDDENKIPFRFVVVYGKGINAGAYPTGTVVVHHDLFNYLENEAQLAFVLAHEISHATQEHAIRQQNDKKGTRTALKIGGIFAGAMGYGGIGNILILTEAAMRNGYARSMENQADRMGLSDMLAHGYDPREAPRTWKVAGMKQYEPPKNLFWSSHDSNAERRSFLWLAIHNTYSNTDFGSLKKDSEGFRRVSAIIQEKYPSKKRKN